MVTNIPELSDALKKSTSLPFLFVGSGFSRRYLGSPDWKGLLTHFAKIAQPEHYDFAYQYYKNKIDTENISKDALLPLIAKEVEKDYTEKILTMPEHEGLRKAYKEDIHNDVSCLNIGMADFFKQECVKFDTPEYSEEVSALKAIKRKVAGVITTNFDTFIEHVFNDCEIYIGQKELLFSQTFEMSEIYKIHGCCSKPESMIVTSDDYADYNKKNAYLAAKLLTIFLEHPVLFL